MNHTISYHNILQHTITLIIQMPFKNIFQIWTKLVTKSQAEILSKRLNEELVKLV